MKKYLLMALFGLFAVLPTEAQVYRNSRYYNPNSDRLDYSRSHRYGHRSTGNYWMTGDTYFGLRVGPSFATVSSDDPYLDGSSMKTGLNVGVAAGFAVAPRSPLFFETGLYYTEKGGKGNSGHTKFTYNLDYLELPLVLKYKLPIDGGTTIEPFLGGYVACGVGGKIKDFGEHAAYSSFSDHPYSFQRFDGGLKLGCGIASDLFYADISYEHGLANISHDDFETSRNNALMLTVGLNF